MAYMARLERAPARLQVLDDRGIPAVAMDLPESAAGPQDADAHLAGAGWSRTADWSETDEGWQAPVLSESDPSA